ncbi:hypothetical protein CKM354_000381500 [Cercospora kikuchii]|uniref:Hydrophobin n=1 Tax=Cercospora kikuchii TaxID=84275 RepID=A0A9P3CIL2_9PEZI|nr:uncharacterized protein CKM354_000381500 [Cercospora kikuchii]GIZ40480.1 hypothetical protein CKM354_000381500 [Cercospora kikuchii]
MSSFVRTMHLLSALSATLSLVSLSHASPIVFPELNDPTFTCPRTQNVGLCCPADVRSNGGVEDCLVATQMVRRTRNPIESFAPSPHHECPTGLSSIPVCCKSSFATQSLQQTGEATINGLNCVSAELPKTYLTRRYSRVAHLERPSATLAYTRSPRQAAESQIEPRTIEPRAIEPRRLEPRRLEPRRLDSLTQAESDEPKTTPATLDDVAKIAKRLETIVRDSLMEVDVKKLADCEDISVGFCKARVHPEVRSDSNNNAEPEQEYKLMARKAALDALTDGRLPELAERSELTSSLDAAGGLSARDAGRIASAERRLRVRLDQAIRVSQLAEETKEGKLSQTEDVEDDDQPSAVLRKRSVAYHDKGPHFETLAETVAQDLVDPLTDRPQRRHLSGLHELKHADAWWYP